MNIPVIPKVTLVVVVEMGLATLSQLSGWDCQPSQNEMQNLRVALSLKPDRLFKANHAFGFSLRVHCEWYFI